MKQQLTHQLDTPDGTVDVLDYGKTANYLSSQTY